MKKVIASAGMLALGAIGVQSATAAVDMAASDKPWSISGTLRGFYDDNYNTQPNGSAAHRASWGLEVRPRADISWASGPTAITASYIYDMRDYFDRPGNQIDQSHDVELFINQNFSERYSLDVEESFVDSQEPDVIDPNLSFPLRSNGDNIRNSASINFHAEVTPLLGFVLGYANTYYDYMGSPVGGGIPYSAELNRFEHLVTLNSRWHVAPETVAILGYQFEAVDYTSDSSVGTLNTPSGTVNVPAKSRNNYTHNVYVGIEQNIGSSLTFSGRAGFQASDYYQQVPGAAKPDDISPFIDLSLAWAYLPDGTLTIGFRNSKNQTDVPQLGATGSANIVQDEESSSVYGTLTQKLTPLSPNLSVSLSAQYQNSRLNAGGPDVTDTFYLVGLNFTYQFNRYLSAEAGYNYDKLDSDIIGRSYDRNRVYVGVTGTY